MRRELTASALAHLFLFLFLVFATMPGASLPPPIPADQVMNVTPVDALPAGLLAAAPAAAAEAAPEPEPPATTEGVKIPEKPPTKQAASPPRPKPPAEKPKEKPREKPRPKAEAAPVAPDSKTLEQTEETTPKATGVYESRVQAGSGVQGGSLLGLKGGTPGGRPSTYPDRITNKIYYTWKNPAKLQESTSCSVVFRIDPTGQASQVALERSSGMAVFDNSTVRAVYEAAPYPPFPRGMNEQYIVMRVIFEYLP